MSLFRRRGLLKQKKDEEEFRPIRQIVPKAEQEWRSRAVEEGEQVSPGEPVRIREGIKRQEPAQSLADYADQNYGMWSSRSNYVTTAAMPTSAVTYMSRIMSSYVPPGPSLYGPTNVWHGDGPLNAYAKAIGRAVNKELLRQCKENEDKEDF